MLLKLNRVRGNWIPLVACLAGRPLPIIQKVQIPITMRMLSTNSQKLDLDDEDFSSSSITRNVRI
jgi:hypothetical protein